MIVEHLIAKGARVDIESIQGVTAMHCALASRRVRCVRALILAGAPIDNRIVSSAACDISPSIIRLFVRAGVDMLATIEGIPWTSLDLVTIPWHLREAAKEYFEKRSIYIARGCSREGDSWRSIFEISAYFLDLPVLVFFADQPTLLKLWRNELGKDLLSVALDMDDCEGMAWLLQNRIINDEFKIDATYARVCDLAP